MCHERLCYKESAYLAFVDPGVPGRDVSDDEDPILLVVVGHLVLPDQLEPVVLGEHLVAVRQDVPVAASNPRQLLSKSYVKSLS